MAVGFQNAEEILTSVRLAKSNPASSTLESDRLRCARGAVKYKRNMAGSVSALHNCWAEYRMFYTPQQARTVHGTLF